MKIEQIKINGFGNLENKEISLKEGINLINGKNETRKINTSKSNTSYFLWGKQK